MRKKYILFWGIKIGGNTKKAGHLSKKAGKRHQGEKWDFSPESGNVDTYGKLSVEYVNIQRQHTGSTHLDVSEVNCPVTLLALWPRHVVGARRYRRLSNGCANSGDIIEISFFKKYVFG